MVSSNTLKFIIVNYVNLLTKCVLKHNLFNPTRTTAWNAHKDNNMILNIDCSNLDSSDFGGLIRNVAVSGLSFADNIYYSNILHVELMTLYHGLRMTCEFDIKDLMCYSYSNSAIKIISKSVNV